MKKSTKKLLPVLATILALTPILQAAYKEPASFTKNLRNSSRHRIVYPANGDDTGVLQRAIWSLQGNVGGIVIVKKGNYQIKNLNLGRNVHLLIDPGATLSLAGGPNDRNMMRADYGISNWSVRGGSLNNGNVASRNFKVSFANRRTQDLATLIFCLKTTNGLLSNFTVNDPNKTAFASVELGWSRETNGVPVDVTLRNVHQYQENYGYGVTQLRAGVRCDLVNLRGKGGVPCRFETGWVEMLKNRAGGVYGCKAQNITSEAGQAAVMLFSHSIVNGNIYVDGANSVGSEFTIYYEKGNNFQIVNHMVSTGLSRAEAERRYPDGSFRELKIKNIRGTYRANVPSRYSHLRYYAPSDFYNRVFKPRYPGVDRVPSSAHGTEPAFNGPSISVIGFYGRPRANGGKLITPFNGQSPWAQVRAYNHSSGKYQHGRITSFEKHYPYSQINSRPTR